MCDYQASAKVISLKISSCCQPGEDFEVEFMFLLKLIMSYPSWTKVGESLASSSVCLCHFEGCGFPGGSVLKVCLPAQVLPETRVPPLDWEEPLEKEMATHSSIPAQKIPWTEQPGGQQSIRSHSRTRMSNWNSNRGRECDREMSQGLQNSRSNPVT